MRIFTWKRSKLRAVDLFDNSGATAIEYALIAALVSLGIVSLLLMTSNTLNDIFVSLSNTFS
jgi:Flp pilus assembly pilin Flp